MRIPTPALIFMACALFLAKDAAGKDLNRMTSKVITTEQGDEIT